MMGFEDILIYSLMLITGFTALIGSILLGRSMEKDFKK